MRTVSLALAILAAIGVAVVSGSGAAPASEEAPLAPATISHLAPGDRANPGGLSLATVLVESTPMVGSASGLAPAPAVASSEFSISEYSIGTGASAEVCTDPNSSASLGMGSETLALPSSLLRTAATNECNEDDDCGEGEYCDLDINECVAENPYYCWNVWECWQVPNCSDNECYGTRTVCGWVTYCNY